jgi:putative transposase
MATSVVALTMSSKKKLNSSRHAVFNVNYHLVFVTKYRRSKVMNDEIQESLKSFIATKAETYSVSIKAIETMNDHIHIFIACSPNILLSALVKKLKCSSSRYLRSKFTHLRNLKSLWAPSYFVESIGCISEPTIIKYINNQKQAVKWTLR